MTVELRDNGGVLLETVTTDIDGNFLFTGYADGTYTVNVTDTNSELTSYAQTGDPDQPGVACTTCDNTSTFVLSGTELDIDFGYRLTGPYSLSGTICLDDTGVDGLCDDAGANGETYLGGRTVYLYTSGGMFIGQTTTDGSGNYTFPNLPDGDYVISTSTGSPPLNIATMTTDSSDVPGTVATSASGVRQTVTIGGASVTDLDFAFELDDVDFGDLPDSYNTLVTADPQAPNGPHHLIPASPNLYLGATPPDAENDGIPTSDASGDGADEDGVALSTDAGGYWITMTDGSSNDFGQLDVTVNGSGWLVVYMDFNNDGDFTDAGEVAYSAAITGTGSVQNIWVDIPDGVTSYTNLNYRVRLLPSEPLFPQLAYVGLATDGEVEDYQSGPIQTPVTLSHFRAHRRGSSVHFNWTTATETANAGFYLYVLGGTGLERVNDRMIFSEVIDSVVPQNYYHVAGNVTGNQFYLGDVSVDGIEELHGPFDINKTYGGTVDAEEVNWNAIKTETIVGNAARNTVEQALARGQSTQAQSALQAVFGSDRAARRLALRRLRRGEITFPAYDLSIDETGLYRITYEELVAAGLDLRGVPQKFIGVSNRGEYIPVYFGGKKRFGPGSTIEFYAQALDTLYTDTNVYRLVVARKAGQIAKTDNRPIADGAAFTSTYAETTIRENNGFYTTNAQFDDPWYDSRIRALGSTPKSLTVNLHADNVQPGAANLVIEMFGITNWPANPDHHVVASFNGQQVGEVFFDGKEGATIEVTLPDGAVQEGVNNLTLTLPADSGQNFEIVAFDATRLTYPRRFVAQDGALTFAAQGDAFRVENLPSADVTAYRVDANGLTRINTVLVDGGEGVFAASFPGSGEFTTYAVAANDAFLTPNSIAPSRTTGNLTAGQADYLMIVHPQFIEGIQPLVAAREAEGYAVRVVNVEDVYAQYAHGIFDPEAIRTYIGEATRQMGIQYVLLVGGDTYDYRGFGNTGSFSFIPTLYRATDDQVRFAPVDPLFADITGDNLPDVSLGRFPVRTVDELNTLVLKTLAYQGKSYDNTGLFVAEEADGGYSFAAGSDEFIANLDGNWDVTRAYLDDLDHATARDVVVETIDDGTAITTYFGHSGADRWTWTGFFSAEDVRQLDNAGRPTMVVQFGCWNTYFVTPAYSTMADEFLLTGDHGAAAVMGPTTLVSAHSERYMGAALMDYTANPGTTIGQAIQAAKADLAASQPDNLDILLGWTILGDPTLVVTP